MNRDDIQYMPIGATHILSRDLLDGVTSPRVNGKLRLQSNRLRREKLQRSLSLAYWPSMGVADTLLMFGNGFYHPKYDAAYNRAYARFRGKIYSGSASLGVTLASYRQSRDMIANRYDQLNRKADGALKWGLKNLRNPSELASLHLEIIFGWTPLLGDIVAATQTLCQEAVPPLYVKGSSTVPVDDSFGVDNSGGWLSYQVNDYGTLRVSVGGCVQIRNPNVWLAERAGLLNPASVAWDLVPWSFVVNMFVNTGQLVQSLTDFSGLTLSDVYIAAGLKAVRTVDTQTTWLSKDQDHPLPSPVSGGSDQQIVRSVYRSVGSIPTPSLQLKVPPLELGTLAMAASLFTQKFSRISQLLAPVTNKLRS